MLTKIHQTLQWCKVNTEGYEGVKIENLSSSWADGKALCALIHHFKPEEINYEECLKLSPSERIEKCLATSQKLGCPDLIDVDDFLPDGPDNYSFAAFLWTFQPYLIAIEPIEIPEINQPSWKVKEQTAAKERQEKEAEEKRIRLEKNKRNNTTEQKKKSNQ